MKNSISGPMKKAVITVPIPTTRGTLTPPAAQSSAPVRTQTRSQMIRQILKGIRLCFSDQISETAS